MICKHRCRKIPSLDRYLNNRNRVLRSTAGVIHWQNVTPAVDRQYSFIGGTYFLDPLTAWVTVAIAPHLFVYRTHDGGQTWQKAQLPGQGIGVDQIFFLNARVGWIL